MKFAGLVSGSLACSYLFFLPNNEAFSIASVATRTTQAPILSPSAASKKNEFLDDQKIFQQGEKLLNGKRCHNKNMDFNLTDVQIPQKDLLPNAPPLTFKKFLTMQEKRVVVSFRFSDIPYLRPYFMTMANKVKKQHIDVIIEKRVLPVVDSASQPLFEVLVDGKTVIGGGSNSRERHVLGGRVDVENTQSVFVSMEHIALAIAKARKKRRPTTVYGEEEDDGEDTPSRRHRAYVRRNGFEQSQD